MKTLALENQSIVRIYNFLNKLELRGKASRGRSKLMARIVEKEKEYIESKKEIQKEYFVLDERDEFVSENGHFKYKDEVTEDDKKELAERINELQKEKFEISFVEYSEKFEALFTELEDLEMTLSGDDALAYDELLDAYDQGGNE